MATADRQTDNWFKAGGADYAKFRPVYPKELAAFLAACTTKNDLAVDIGCGNGQLTVLLADFFKNVIGIDPSQSQIDNAKQHTNLTYICAPAEKLPKLKPVNLITVAQAAHWLDLPVFYNAIKNIADDNCILALICYGKVRLDDEINPIFDKFYKEPLYKYWTFDRSLVDQGYAHLEFPFDELPGKAFTINYSWTCNQFIGYISTWSAVKHLRQGGESKAFDNFTARLARVWGDASTKRSVSWPIHFRLANINPV